MSNKCRYASDNKFFHCPPKMADGRHFTDYRPNCELHKSLPKGLNSNQMRNWLTRNADSVMKKNNKEAMNKNGCGPCSGQVGTMLPETTKVRCDKRHCKVAVSDVNGLGHGRVYSEEPLANINSYGEVVVRSKDDENCCSRPEDVFNYYGDAIKSQNHDYLDRLTVHGGEAMKGGDPESFEI